MGNNIEIYDSNNKLQNILLYDRNILYYSNHIKSQIEKKWEYIWANILKKYIRKLEKNKQGLKRESIEERFSRMEKNLKRFGIDKIFLEKEYNSDIFDYYDYSSYLFCFKNKYEADSYTVVYELTFYFDYWTQNYESVHARVKIG